MKKIASLILLLALIPALFSCGGEKKYEYCELILPLNSDFFESEADGVFEIRFADGRDVGIALTLGSISDTAFANGKIAVAVRRISFSAALDGGIPETLSQKQLAAYMQKETGVGGEIFTAGDAPYYKYKKTDGAGNEYLFVVSAYRSKYAYFTVTYLLAADMEDQLMPEVTEYIRGTGFTQ